MPTREPHGRAGGEARAEKLPPEKRSEIAKKGATARWGARPLEATHKGNFKEEFGVDVECYVLDDQAKTAVVSQTGMARALGMASRGHIFPSFIASNAMAKFVGTELRQKIENPLKFQWGTGGTESPPTTAHGFDATLLIDVCQAIVRAEAEGAIGGKRYKAILKQAHIILGASAKSGIRGLVYALAGYNPSTEEVIAAFKIYVQQEARKYESEFPTELYTEWHRLYNIPVPVRGKPWQFRYLTVRHIYYPLAKSNGKILELLKALKAQGGDQQKKLFQFLSTLGTRALRIHLGRVLEMAESSRSQVAYENRFAERFGGQTELDLVIPPSSTSSPPLSEQSPPAVPE